MHVTELRQPVERARDEAILQPVRRSWPLLFAAIGAAVVFSFLLTLAWGSVTIPLPEVARILAGQEGAKATWTDIVRDLRLPRALTAVLCGAALGVAGLQMQTLFRNALAEPYILGVSSGASLGVGLVILTTSGVTSTLLAGLSVVQNLSILSASALGAFAVLGVMLLIAAWVRSPVIVLVAGVMISAFILAFVNLLIYFARPEAVKAYTDWYAGSFQGVTWTHLPILGAAVVVGVVLAGVTTKQLNVFLLGEHYAQSMGLSVQRLRWMTMIGASVLAGSVTAYAGPIAFLGIAAPHLARGLLVTSDHRALVPGSILLGALLALWAGLLAQSPASTYLLPLNSAMAIIGAPVVTWILLRLARNSSRGLTV
jgi:iron complex transport system permease protein